MKLVLLAAARGGGGGGSIYSFSTATFTANNNGNTGPVLSTAKAGITGTPSPATWYDTYLNMTTQGIMRWTVPETGTYTIRAMGASGGGGTLYGTVNSGGRGAIVQANFALTKGQVLQILVGQGGASAGPGGCDSAGGGGTFVVDESNNPLIIAGGGGGGSTINNNNGQDGQTTRNGGTISGDSSGAGGTNGSGGSQGFAQSGAGFSGNGAYGTWTTPPSGFTVASSFLNGGVGATSTNSIDGWPRNGGFGGGGAAHGNCCIGAGAGGGYSGGGGGPYQCQQGAGGGSFIASSAIAGSVQTSNGLYDGSSTFGGSAIINLSAYNSYGGCCSTYGANGSVSIYNLTPQPPLYSFSTATFTTGGAVGRTGPILSQAKAGITGTPSPATWYDTYLSMTNQGIMRWTVPVTGTYRLEVAGASGGLHPSYGQQRSKGARIIGDVTLIGGTIINIVVGQAGANTGSPYGPGGGGGSFVYIDSSNPIIIAGGGAGVSTSWDSEADGQAGQNAGLAKDSSGNFNSSLTGYPGQQVAVGEGSWVGPGRQQCSGGGCGWKSIGADSRSNAPTISKDQGNPCGNSGCGGSYVLSPIPFYGGRGSCNEIDYGGFGGGGGGGCDGEGGGGGYTGGAGTWATQAHGGGGGSYNSGSNQSNTTGYQNGNGYVVITRV